MEVDRALWQRLLPLLDEAFEQPVASRAAWARRLPVDAGTQAALLRLLAERRQLEQESFLGALPALDDPGPTAATLAGWQPGQAVGRYRLLRELGRGGMSVVWLAERDDGQLRRQVALKFPHAGPDQAALAKRLRRERDFLAGLEHHNIARLYDVGSTADGVPYLVLEYVDGQTLLAWCDERRLDIDARLQVFLQVLRAVQHAHSQLVLHRDIKPSNILINAEGDVKLLDFGIAKLLASDPAAAEELTRQGARALTPGYAAPEQVAGAPVGTACDIYSLGVVLFELLTGERPYRPSRCSAGATEDAKLAAPPRRASQVWQGDRSAQCWSSTATRMFRRLRGGLDTIVQCALRKAPEQRYSTVDAFAQDIRRWMADLPPLAEPTGRWTLLRLFAVRHRLALSAAAVATLALGIGIGSALWQGRQTRLEAAKAAAVKDFLVSLFESNSVEQSDSLRKRQQSVQALLEDGAKALESGLAGQPAIQQEMQAVVGRLLHDLDISGPAVEVRRRRVESFRSQDADAALRVAAGHDLADSLLRNGDGAAADRVIEESLSLCPTSADKASVACLGLRVAQGVRAVRENKLAAAAEAVEPALRVLEVQAPESEQTAEGFVALGLLRARQNRPEEAQASFERGSELRSRLWGAQSLRLARSRYALAIDLWNERRQALAEAELVAAVPVFRAALGAQHPTTAFAELQLGHLKWLVWGSSTDDIVRASKIVIAHASSLDPERVFEAMLIHFDILVGNGRLSEAGELLAQMEARTPTSGDLQHAFELARANYLQVCGEFDAARQTLRRQRDKLLGSFDPSHPYVAEIEFRLARVDLVEDRLDEARIGFERVLETRGGREDTFGSTKHRATVGIARVAIDRGQFEVALPVMSASFDHARRTPRSERQVDAIADVNTRMAQVLCGLGRYAEALALFAEAIEAFRERPPQSPLLAVYRAHFASCLARAGRSADANKQLELVNTVLRNEPKLGPQYVRAARRATERAAAATKR